MFPPRAEKRERKPREGVGTVCVLLEREDAVEAGDRMGNVVETLRALNWRGVLDGGEEEEEKEEEKEEEELEEEEEAEREEEWDMGEV